MPSWSQSPKVTPQTIVTALLYEVYECLRSEEPTPLLRTRRPTWHTRSRQEVPSYRPALRTVSDAQGDGLTGAASEVVNIVCVPYFTDASFDSGAMVLDII